MTEQEMKMLDRINEYANKVMPDIDPQKTQVSVQLEKLMPILETVAKENGISIEEMFIKYMDLASEASIMRETKLQGSIGNTNSPSPSDVYDFKL